MMGQAISKIKGLSLGAEDQTFPPNDSAKKPKDNSIEWDKYNASERSQLMYRCSDDLWKVERKIVLVDPDAPKVVHSVGTNTNPKMRNRAVSAGAIRRPPKYASEPLPTKVETASNASPRLDGRAKITRRYDPGARKWLTTIW